MQQFLPLSDRTIGILGLVLAVIGLVTGYVFYVLHQKELERLRRERTRADWDDIERGIQDIRAQLIKDDFIPDILICPLGTSLLVTELLVLSLEEKKPYLPIYVLETIDAKLEANKLDGFIGEGADKLTVDHTDQKYLIPPHFSKLRGQKALLFDDGAVTGNTLVCLKEGLRNDPFQINVRTAILFADHAARLLESRVEDKGPEKKRLNYVHRWVSTTDFHMPWGHILEDKRYEEKGVTETFVKSSLAARKSKSISAANSL